MASLMSTPFRALWWKPKIIAVTRVWQSGSHSRSHRHLTTFGWCIGEVLWNCNSWRWWWKAQAFLEVGVGTHLSSYWQRSTDNVSARLCQQRFQAENAGKCVIWSLKIQNFPGELASDPLAGPGIALAWPFHGHIALQTTLSAPTPLHVAQSMRWLL